MMKKEEINQIAYDVADLIPTLKLVQNYLSCINLSAYKASTNEDRISILISLVHDRGLENINETIENTIKIIDDSASNLMDLASELDETPTKKELTPTTLKYDPVTNRIGNVPIMGEITGNGDVKFYQDETNGFDQLQKLTNEDDEILPCDTGAFLDLSEEYGGEIATNIYNELFLVLKENAEPIKKLEEAIKWAKDNEYWNDILISAQELYNDQHAGE